MDTGAILELKPFLDDQYERFNVPGFIADDPVSVPHRFSKKEDIEIAGFLTATIAWGNRTSILKNADRLMQSMDRAPYSFLMGASEKDFAHLATFVHRTFNGDDARFFMLSLQNVYRRHGGLERVFELGFKADGTLFSALAGFRDCFFELPHLQRTSKHVSNVAKGASAKRLCMFLRWMVRNDGRGVDFGLWKSIPPSALMLPLDVHTGTVSRKLGLLQRKQNDWRTVEELTSNLRILDANDPVKYDFALFGMGVSKTL
jgi:uncharacterized protein (TIGR02757 family)